MTKSNYTQARIAQERTKQITLICLTLFGLSIVVAPVLKLIPISTNQNITR